ncbi:MAG: hypothetical protein R6U56_06650 [Opitutales bacterium]
MNNSKLSGRGKVLWVACDSFDKSLKKNPKQSIVQAADTPNLDALCQLSETGLIKAGKGTRLGGAKKFSDLTRLRSLAVTNHPSHRALERSFQFDRYETVHGLSGFEDVLEAEWDSYDFFYMHLDGEYKSILEVCDPESIEWVEMVDAWLPGLLGRFQPEVFALSGDLDAVLSQDASILAMIHSPWVEARPAEGLSPSACRKGRLGDQLDLRQWLLLLMAHSSRRETYGAIAELYTDE